MRPVIRYQSQLLYRRSYKPVRVLLIRSALKPVSSFAPRAPVRQQRLPEHNAPRTFP